MSQRHVEIFSAGCSCCTETVDQIQSMICDSCSVDVLDMKDEAVAERARGLGIRSVPAVVIDGELAGCCTARGVDEATLRAAGVGRPLA